MTVGWSHGRYDTFAKGAASSDARHGSRNANIVPRIHRINGTLNENV